MTDKPVMYLVTKEFLNGSGEVWRYLFRSKESAYAEVLACAKEYMMELQAPDDFDPEELSRMELMGDLVNEAEHFYLTDEIRCHVEVLTVIDA